MPPARLILCERKRLWATALAPHLRQDVRLCQTRRLADVESVLWAHPASLVAVEVVAPGEIDEVLALLTRVHRRYPQANVVMLCAQGVSNYQWLLREAGALEVFSSPRMAASLAGLAARQSDRHPATAAPLAQQIWDELPWSPVA